MKFTKGDYIRYTANQEQEVIDGLIGLRYAVYDHKMLKPDYQVFLFVDGDGYWLNNVRYFTRAGNRSGRYNVDRTEEFFAYLSGKNSFEEQLPPKFYIDCGDRIEVREWLHKMGFKWCDGGSLLSHLINFSGLYIDKENKACYAGVANAKRYTIIKPKLTVTSFEVDSAHYELDKSRNKELEALKQAHKELGERIDKLCE